MKGIELVSYSASSASLIGSEVLLLLPSEEELKQITAINAAKKAEEEKALKEELQKQRMRSERIWRLTMITCIILFLVLFFMPKTDEQLWLFWMLIPLGIFGFIAFCEVFHVF